MTTDSDATSQARTADAQQLRTDLAQLAGNAQFALALSYREHLTQPQIAVRMLITEPAVRKLISGAMQDLAQIIIWTVPPIVAAPAA